MIPDVTGTIKYLSNRIMHYHGIWVQVMEGIRTLCRRLCKNQFTAPTQVNGKSQPNREQRKKSEPTNTRQNVSNASLLMMVDDFAGGV
jgi:hypothetical protein